MERYWGNLSKNNYKYTKYTYIIFIFICIGDYSHIHVLFIICEKGKETLRTILCGNYFQSPNFPSTYQLLSCFCDSGSRYIFVHYQPTTSWRSPCCVGLTFWCLERSIWPVQASRQGRRHTNCESQDSLYRLPFLLSAMLTLTAHRNVTDAGKASVFEKRLYREVHLSFVFTPVIEVGIRKGRWKTVTHFLIQILRLELGITWESKITCWIFLAPIVYHRFSCVSNMKMINV